MLTYLRICLYQSAENEYYVLLKTLVLNIKLDVSCHMTVSTYPWATQCAAVSTKFGEMRLPPQKVLSSIRMAA